MSSVLLQETPSLINTTWEETVSNLKGKYHGIAKHYLSVFENSVLQVIITIIKNSKMFFINRNLTVLVKFVINYHQSVKTKAISVSSHRCTELEWTAT